MHTSASVEHRYTASKANCTAVLCASAGSHRAHRSVRTLHESQRAAPRRNGACLLPIPDAEHPAFYPIGIKASCVWSMPGIRQRHPRRPSKASRRPSKASPADCAPARDWKIGAKEIRSGGERRRGDARRLSASAAHVDCYRVRENSHERLN
jgi:hypothetical protein